MPRLPVCGYDKAVNILLVEDEDSIAEPLIEGLEREGHAVTRVALGRDAIAAAEPDLILLDLRLPDIDGYEVCRAVRGRSQVPIIMVTAKGEEIDKVLGLELGADDYLVKPFGFRELLARMAAVTRRTMASATPEAPSEDRLLRVGSLCVDRRAHRAFVQDRELDLTPTEFALLIHLAQSPGAALSREQLLKQVWNTSWTSSSKTVDVHMASLRRKLVDRRWIETVRGVGYRLVEIE